MEKNTYYYQKQVEMKERKRLPKNENQPFIQLMSLKENAARLGQTDHLQIVYRSYSSLSIYIYHISIYLSIYLSTIDHLLVLVVSHLPL